MTWGRIPPDRNTLLGRTCLALKCQLYCHQGHCVQASLDEIFGSDGEEFGPLWFLLVSSGQDLISVFR